MGSRKRLQYSCSGGWLIDEVGMKEYYMPVKTYFSDWDVFLQIFSCFELHNSKAG